MARDLAELRRLRELAKDPAAPPAERRRAWREAIKLMEELGLLTISATVSVSGKRVTRDTRGPGGEPPAGSEGP